MKKLMITASLLFVLNVMACDEDKGKDEEEEEKDQRITLVRSVR